jgi:hypothetical protein
VTSCSSNYHAEESERGDRWVPAPCETRESECHENADDNQWYTFSPNTISSCRSSCPVHTSANDEEYQCVVNSCISRKPDVYGFCFSFPDEDCYPLLDGNGCKESGCPLFTKELRGVCYPIECTQRCEYILFLILLCFSFIFFLFFFLEHQLQIIFVALILMRIVFIMVLVAA